ncbi:MAG: hypothetical protein R6V23_09090 [Bacteroidales bacterium]
MKKHYLKVTAALLAALTIGFTSCDDDDPNEVDKQNPSLVSVSINNDNTEATVYFSEGIYKMDDATGNLDAESLEVSVSGGSLTVESYTVDHTAGNNTALVNLTLSDTDSDGSELLNISVTASSGYDADGNSMEAGSANVNFNTFTGAIDPEEEALTAYAESGTLPSDYKSVLLAHFNDNNNVATSDFDIDAENIVPATGEAGDGVAPSDAWFDNVTYQGAFEPGGSNWAEGWNLAFGFDGTSTATNEVVITDDITSDVTWTKDNIYILDGFISVTSDATLTIEPGTMIQGESGQGENASALIIRKDGKIMAEGTAEEPIVFTGKGDEYDGSGYGIGVRGLWGGLIMLGEAPTNNSIEKRIEGVPEDENAFYGGDDSDHNSGVVKYVTIRHGGTDIGAGNEINGFTLGGVGSGTTLEYVAVISNVDDGVEFFGGVPNLKNCVVAYCGDDSYDYDEGFSGKGQFWVAIQSDETGDRLGEHDGGTGSDEEATPYALPTIYNATYIGNGGKTLMFRDNAGGIYANSIFANTTTGITVEYRDDKNSSYDQLVDGNLVFKNNIFVNVGF